MKPSTSTSTTLVTFTTREGEVKTGTLMKRQGALIQVMVGGDPQWVKSSLVTLTEGAAVPSPVVPSGTGRIAAELEKATPKEKPAPKAKATPKERDPDEVCLKDICEDYGIVPRIARKKLRKEFGTLENQTSGEARWCWPADSSELVKVYSMLGINRAEMAGVDMEPTEEEVDPESSDADFEGNHS
jgi:hypothetical protein